jgi:nitrite reductase/ring-hydroxylating ferredoxin subunit
MTTISRDRVRLLDADELPDDGMKAVKPDGLEPVAVFRVAGEFYATQDTCSHAQASLSAGFLDSDRVGCPVHTGEFCIRTGKALCFPATVDLRTFKVWREGGEIFADLSNAQPDFGV